MRKVFFRRFDSQGWLVRLQEAILLPKIQLGLWGRVWSAQSEYWMSPNAGKWCSRKIRKRLCSLTVCLTVCHHQSWVINHVIVTLMQLAYACDLSGASTVCFIINQAMDLGGSVTSHTASFRFLPTSSVCVCVRMWEAVSVSVSPSVPKRRYLEKHSRGAGTRDCLSWPMKTRQHAISSSVPPIAWGCFRCTGIFFQTIPVSDLSPCSSNV